MQKTTRLQRLLAVVVAVFMAVCCLPLSTFAEETLEEPKVVDVHLIFEDSGNSNQYVQEATVQRFVGDIVDVDKLCASVELKDGYKLSEKQPSDKYYIDESDNEFIVYVEKEPITFVPASYEVNFLDGDGNPIISSTKIEVDVIEGQETRLLMDSLNTNLQKVLDMGYELKKVECDNKEVTDATVLEAGTHKVVAHFTEKVSAPVYQDAIYELNFVDQDGNPVVKSFSHNGTVVEGETTYLLSSIEPSVKTVLDKGYELRKVEFANGDAIDETTVMTAGDVTADKHKIVVHVAKKVSAPVYQDAIYELNFVDQDGNPVVKSFSHNGTVVEGETTYLLSSIEPSVKTVLDKGYELRKVEFANGDAIDETTVMTAGDVTADKHKIVVHVTKSTKVEWLDAIYELNFVDQDGKNVESFQHNGTVMNGQTTYLLAALEPSVKTVLDKGYELRKVEFSSGDPVDETTVMTAGNVGTDKHKVVVHVTKKVTATAGNNTTSSSTTTVSSNNNKTTTTASNEVVKAAAPADNTTKVMPQTGMVAETPVFFGVMMIAALAGAGAYLFALRKKLN